MTFAPALLAALALPTAVHAADCAAALRIALPDAHVTAASAVPSNDSLRALGEKPYCRVEATVDEETHIADASTYALRRFASGTRRDSHRRYEPITASTAKQKMGYQPGTPVFVMS